ncbi:hypothetical protein Tco_0682048 [Tanacetum coccineum]|uniref:Uncharacterized protein n=1 Tax=Tanacetum coccineum TaxID=301880 RepID=A0ABQ4XQB4_9ASTR
MRTLASVEVEIILILGLPCCLSSSSVRCLENVVDSHRMSTPVFAYLDGTDIESGYFEDPVEIETPESRHTIAPPTSLPKGTLSNLVPILCRTARMAVHVPPEMSSSLSPSMAKMAAVSDSAFRKRFRPSYESLPSLSPPDLPLRKHYGDTSELVEDDEEEDDEEEDEEIEESLDSDRDKGLAVGDEGPNMGVESHGLDDESRGLNDEDHSVESDGLGLREEEEAVPESQQRAVLVVGTTVSAPLGLRYRELRRRELAIVEDHVYSTFEVGTGFGSAQDAEQTKSGWSASRQPTLTTWTDPEDGIVYIDVHAYPLLALPAPTPPLPEWSSGSLPISPAPSIVPTPISSPMIPLTVPSPTTSPATIKMSGAVRDEIFSQRYRFRSLEHEQERVAVTFGAIWRPVLALESWAGQTDAQRAALWHAISDTQGENRELRLQLAEERRARLELAEIVDSMRRGQEPRGDV